MLKSDKESLLNLRKYYDDKYFKQDQNHETNHCKRKQETIVNCSKLKEKFIVFLKLIHEGRHKSKI